VRLVTTVSKVTMLVDIAIITEEALVNLLTKLKLITSQPGVTSVKQVILAKLGMSVAL
jgi:hypothetical protein